MTELFPSRDLCGKFMPIRVAYDISVPAAVGSGGKAGIARVSEELLYALSRLPEVSPTLVGTGIWHRVPDAPTMDARVREYVAAMPRGVTYSFAKCYKSRLGLDRALWRLFGDLADARYYQLRRPTLKWLIHRTGRVLVAQARRLDSRMMLDDSAFDVFHSPFVRLPPRRVTGRLPRVLTVYDLIPVLSPELTGPFYTANFRRILKSLDMRSDWVTTISQHTKDQFCQYTGMSADRVFVTPLAASDLFHPSNDAEAEAARRKYGIPDGDYLLSVANPQPNKNIPHLIRAFARLLMESPGLEVNLVLAGLRSGLLQDELNAVAGSPAAAAGLLSRLVFTGYIADEDLSAVYSGAKAFVFPSLSEGFGLPILEAMQCGVPVVTCNTTSLPEVAGDAALMVDPKDEAALSGAMHHLLTDAAAAAAMAKKGLERAREFTWARCAELTADVYRKAIAAA
jgi:glycosyltransferase involved in cell wall biosynthesis